MRLNNLSMLSMALVLGVLAGACGALGIRSITRTPTLSPRHPIKVILHRVKIKDGALPIYARWQDFLHAQHPAAVATLDREHTYVEAMFRDVEHDPNTLFWLEVKDEAGASVDDSNLAVDREHKHYMRQVLRSNTWSVLRTENVLVAPFIETSVARHQASPGF